MNRPLSIENRWDILYRDYPDVYEAFSAMPYAPTTYEHLAGVLELHGKTVVDVGSGTGASSRALAALGARVVGCELEPAMLRQAARHPESIDPARLAYVAGSALSMPFARQSLDCVVGITLALYPPEQYRQYILEGLRAARERVVYLGIAPDWYGGDLARELDVRDDNLAVIDDIFCKEAGFAFHDVYSRQEYGTLENIIATYGFIFGRAVIERLKRENKTSILWKFRIYERRIGRE